MVMRLPDTNPINDPTTLWALQNELLSLAELYLGPRNPSKKIYQPIFAGAFPCIRNTPDLGGAFVELSRAGKFYWPTVVFEMAHETVHLLDPIVGSTNNLEEGVATAFSVEIQSSYGIDVRPEKASYTRALLLCRKLPLDPLLAGKRVRERFGALSTIKENQLGQIFPSVEQAVLVDLAKEFVRG